MILPWASSSYSITPCSSALPPSRAAERLCSSRAARACSLRILLSRRAPMRSSRAASRPCCRSALIVRSLKSPPNLFCGLRSRSACEAEVDSAVRGEGIGPLCALCGNESPQADLRAS